MNDQNFEMFQGDTKKLAVTVADSAGAAVDLTGATVKWRMAPKVASPTATLSKQTGGAGIDLTDPVAGVFTVNLNSSDTQQLVGEFYHEAEVTDAAANITTVLTGRITIKPSLIGA